MSIFGESASPQSMLRLIAARGRIIAARGAIAFCPCLIAAHRPSFANYATTGGLSGRVLCSASTSLAVISVVAVIIPVAVIITVAVIGADPNPARANFDVLGLRGGAAHYQGCSCK